MPAFLRVPVSAATERQLLVAVLTKLFSLDSRMELLMTDMSTAIDHLSSSLAKEIKDIRDDLLGKVDALTAENASVKAELAEKVRDLDAAIARVEGMADDLDANDAPAPAEPGDGDTTTEPGDGTTTPEPGDGSTPGEQPTEPTTPTEPGTTEPETPATPAEGEGDGTTTPDVPFDGNVSA